MVVFDNIIFSLQKSGGISVVWYEMLKRVVKNDAINKLFIEYDDAYTNIFRQHLTIKKNELVVKKRNPFFIIKRYMNPRLPIERPFIFHSSYYRIATNKKAINITTIHDFIYENYMKGMQKYIHCLQKHKAIKKSDIIICISESTKKDLLKFLPQIDEKKIRVIYNGVSDDYFPLTSNHSDIKLTLPFPTNSFILFVGARPGYKRFDFAVDVVKCLKYNLIIIGGGDLSSEEAVLLKSRLKEEQYRHIQYINNQELNYLYNNAFCLIYPSEYEGFGIPVIEAQKAGCPVVAYNGSSVAEITGDNYLLFDDYSIDAIIPKIECLKNTDKRNEIINNGLENVKRFSWEKTYLKLIATYQEALRINKIDCCNNS
jgi:mannosyltransferase